MVFGIFRRLGPFFKLTGNDVICQNSLIMHNEEEILNGSMR